MNNADNFWGNLTSFHNETINATYPTMVEALGTPEFYPEPDKVQVEWELKLPETDEPIFIYDWKEYGRDVRDGEHVEWHIGRRNATDFEKVSQFLSTKGLKATKDNGKGF